MDLLQGSKMERFVFHNVADNVALFSVHIPVPASYFFEIFSNKIDDSNKVFIFQLDKQDKV